MTWLSTIRALNPSASPWDAANEERTLRAAALILGVVWPFLHFLTRMEDPASATPLWEYQLIGLVHVAPVALSLTRWGARRFRPMLNTALLIAVVWGSFELYRGGYAGRRVAVASVLMPSVLLISDLRVLAVYLGFMIGGNVVGVRLRHPTLPGELVVTRVVMGSLIMGVVAGLRHWSRVRVARSERRFQSLVLGSPVPIFIVDHDHCVMANDSARALLGIEPGDRLSEALVGEPPWWSTPGRNGSTVTTMLGPDGNELHCELSFAPIEGAPGVVQVTVGDRTSDRELMRTKDALLAGVARELRPSVETVRGALSAVQETASPDETRSAILRDGLSATARMQRLLDDMALVTTLQGDVRQDELRRHPARDLVEQALQLVEQNTRERGVAVSVSGPSTAGVSVRTNIEAAAHALANVVVHAAQHCGPGGVAILVEGMDAMVHYTVGCGPEGTVTDAGLGVTLARSLVERMGGRLQQVKGALRIELPAA